MSTRPQPTTQRAAYEKALQFLYDRINYEKLVDGTSRYPFRLRRMAELARRLGLGHLLHPSGGDADPSGTESAGVAPTGVGLPPLPLAHIAGTKGKGSTATMIAAVLTAANVRTGLYTSPHLHRLEERFRVDGQPCTEDELVGLVDAARDVSQSMLADGRGDPTFFELTTALALLHFHRGHCDALVLEVGLGGRLDSTNICRPTVTAITSIGLDHQQVLGNTREQIAREKAGIIKPGVPVVSGVTQDGPRQIIAEIAQQKSAPLYQLGVDFDFNHRPADGWGSIVDLEAAEPMQTRQDLMVTLEGRHQGRNTAVALAVLDLMQRQSVSATYQPDPSERQRTIAIPDQRIRQGLSRVSDIGRMERVRLPDDRTVIVDSAHNDDSISALCDTLKIRFIDRPITFLFGTSVDKQAEPMLNRLSSMATTLVLTQFAGNPRFFPTDRLQRLVPESWPGRFIVENNVDAACDLALAQTPPGGVMVVCGSFFLVAQTRQKIHQLACQTA